MNECNRRNGLGNGNRFIKYIHGLLTLAQQKLNSGSNTFYSNLLSNISNILYVNNDFSLSKNCNILSMFY